MQPDLIEELIDAVIADYHTTRLSEVSASAHIMGKPRFKAALARLTAEARAKALDEGRMAAERAVVEWQPIETAPRDGTAILAYGEHLPTYFYAIIFERGEWKYCSQGKGWAAPPGMPTHWMPLPAPPT